MMVDVAVAEKITTKRKRKKQPNIDNKVGLLKLNFIFLWLV